MTLRITRSVIALAAAGLLFGAVGATAAPRNIEVRGDGSCTSGATLTAAGTTRGSGLGRADFTASITVGGVAYSLPGGGDCSVADGSMSFTRSGAVLAADVAGVVCEVGLSGAGTALLPNDVFEGSYAVDAASSTGRFASNTGAGNMVLGCDPGGTASHHMNGSLATP
jgi:hypothetical protein